MKKKAKAKKTKHTTPEWFKHDAVMSYLLKKYRYGQHGATNFEMMMDLHMCDVRKRISVLRKRLAEINPEWHIDDIWFESNDEHKRPFKRYYLMRY